MSAVARAAARRAAGLLNGGQKRLALVGLALVGLMAAGCAEDVSDEGAPIDLSEMTDVVVTTESTTTEGDAPLPSSAESAAGGSDEVCSAIDALGRAVRASAELDFGRPWSELQPAVVAVLDEAAARYAAILAVIPADVADDVRTLVTYNEDQSAAAAAAPSLEEFQSALATPSDDVSAATANLVALASDRCGVGLTID